MTAEHPSPDDQTPDAAAKRWLGHDVGDVIPLDAPDGKTAVPAGGSAHDQAINELTLQVTERADQTFGRALKPDGPVQVIFEGILVEGLKRDGLINIKLTDEQQRLIEEGKERSQRRR